MNACFKKSLFPAHGVHGQWQSLTVRERGVRLLLKTCVSHLRGGHSPTHSYTTARNSHPTHCGGLRKKQRPPPLPLHSASPPVPRGMYRGKSGRCVVCVSLVPAPPPPPPRDTARRRQTKQSGGVAGLICANLSEDLGCFLSMFRCENVCACE